MTKQERRIGVLAHGPARAILLSAVALGAVVAGMWAYDGSPPAEVPVPAAMQAPLRSLEAAASATATFAAVAGASAAPPASAARPADVPGARTAEPAMDQWFSPAEALRKVQVGLHGGTPEEALEAARTLQMCLRASGAPEALYALRDQSSGRSEALKKAMDSAGGINKVIEVAQAEARRCQVFDQATLGRRMELFQRAYEGGAEGAVVDYLMALQNPLEKQKPDPALVAKLQADVRDAAAVGETGALQYLSQATGDRARELGITPVVRAGYQAAWTAIMEERHPGIAAIIEKATAPFRPPESTTPLNAAEQAAANAMAQQIVDGWRSKNKSKDQGG